MKNTDRTIGYQNPENTIITGTGEHKTITYTESIGKTIICGDNSTLTVTYYTPEEQLVYQQAFAALHPTPPSYHITCKPIEFYPSEDDFDSGASPLIGQTNEQNLIEAY
jgi:hypothetical protein